MNKPVPWSIKGVGFENREAARAVAKRHGVSVGEWLNSVIAERAASLGVSVDEISREDRLDALAARLAGVAESDTSRENPEVSRSEMSRSHDITIGAPESDKMSQEFADDERLVIGASGRRGGRAGSKYTLFGDHSPARGAKYDVRPGDALKQWENDALLDEALRLAEHRALASDQRAAFERQRQEVAALSREMERLNVPTPIRSRAEPSGIPDSDYARQATIAKARPQPRPIQDAVGAVAARLEQLERRIAQRDSSASADKRILTSLDRLEERVEHMVRPVESPHNEGRAEDIHMHGGEANVGDGRPFGEVASRVRTQAEIERIDRKLAAILARLDRQPDQASSANNSSHVPDAADRIDSTRSANASGTSPVSIAVADVAKRQASLDAQQENKSALLRETSYPTMGAARDASATQDAFQLKQARVAQHAPEKSAAPPVQQLNEFRSLQDAFAALATRLETRLDTTLTERLPSKAYGDNMRSLETGIAGLGHKIDTLKQQAGNPEKAADLNGGWVLIRKDIASLSSTLADLSAQRSVASLEEGMRALGERMDRSRVDGVSEAVLAPIERLNTDLSNAIRSNDPGPALHGVKQQLNAIEARFEDMETRGLDPDSMAVLHDLTAEVRDLIQATAGQFPGAAWIEDQFERLGARVDVLADLPPRAAMRDLEAATNEIRSMLVRFSPSGILQDMSQKLDTLSERMSDVEQSAVLPAALLDGLNRRIDESHASLSEQITARGAEPAVVDLRPLEAMIGGLSGKIDGLRNGTSDMHALGGLVRGLAAQIEEARLPTADAKVLDLLEVQVSRLAERLDRSDASLDAIASLELLIGDLFKQLEETRLAAVEAADNSAKSANSLARNVSIGADQTVDLSSREALELVSQELSEFRKAQQTSEGRVHATLVTLNDTLERMVDRLTKDSVARHQQADASQGSTHLGIPLVAPRVSGDAQAELEAAIKDVRAARDAVVSRDSTMEKRPVGANEPPAIEVDRNKAGASGPDVSPLIAAARRAAQAAQVSAASVSKSPSKPPRLQAVTQSEEAKRPGFLGQKRRPILLSLAGVVLLIGALQLVRLSTDVPRVLGLSEADPATATTAENTAPATDQALSPVRAQSKVTASIDGDTPAAANASIPQKATVAPEPVSKPDPALAGLPAGLRDLAMSGDPAAQFETAVRLSEGRGVTKDLKAALPWFERAAKQGFAMAQYRVGSLYEKGIGVTADSALAISWYERAAAQGNVRAMHNLAVMSAEGAGSKPDYTKAASWFKKAADFGVRDSQYNLAILDARGLGVPQSLSQSYTWFAVAAAQGDGDAAKKRDDVGAKLDASALDAAKAAAETFKPTPLDHAANEVSAPLGGWDALAGKATPNAASVEGSKVKVNM